MLGVSLLLLLYMNVVRRWEDNFDTWPWKQQNSAKSKLYCPFTGEQVSMLCPCCEAFVSNAAFHNKDLLTTFLVGEGVLGWPKAHKALKMTDDPAKGRTMLDEALDLRGNFYFGAVGACCVGCAAWQRIFNLLPRWALTAACLSLVGTYTPWAFGQSLANLKSWGVLMPERQWMRCLIEAFAGSPISQ
ncbi:hypothetical protein WJX75_002978 [Coccomyxa subellipsoidea]|uniref:Transmembrane protein n=1 Tax=Coccomyxa subellipsoidea TaxID=248742 RepID=A0ABR2YML1_9CHLO